MTTLRAIDGEGGTKVIAALADISPELGHQVVAWAFGDMCARDSLAARERQLVTLGMLTALGGCERLDRTAEASAAYDRAIKLVSNDTERRFLTGRRNSTVRS